MMQFTVIIEFLMPGLAALLLGWAFLPCSAIPQLPQMPFDETGKALFLLAIAYPVGHLVNFPVYVVLQHWLLVPLARRRTVRAYLANSIDLADLATKHLRQSGIAGAKEFSAKNSKDRKRLFDYMQALIFAKNIEHRNSDYLYHQGLQRLARGMLIPILMGAVLVVSRAGPAWGVLVTFLGVFFFVCLALLIHSVRREEDKLADFFIAMEGQKERGTE